ncbi:hypothetical protein PYCCODRAFT_705373 [Trametes coccinea BRFM310]|uniref:Uncharacterized protein n=1 Tax=Trametes coccinea (strain BRFM310) TaxID=1353009 RepID=A0A1Y2II51_TRAC3|nr:hypothetical protein PYCCODRAFT_705373 [Trametes coccinea BRFM310]
MEDAQKRVEDDRLVLARSDLAPGSPGQSPVCDGKYHRTLSECAAMGPSRSRSPRRRSGSGGEDQRARLGSGISAGEGPREAANSGEVCELGNSIARRSAAAGVHCLPALPPGSSASGMAAKTANSKTRTNGELR